MKRALLIFMVLTMVIGLASCASAPKVTINSAADLQGKKIAVQEGTTGDLIASEIEGAQITRFKKATETGMELKNGRVDAVILDEMPAKKIVDKNSDLTILSFPPTDEIEKYAIAVKKGNQELLDKINETLNDMKADGSYDTLFEIYISGEELSLPPIPEYTADGDIIMGTNAEFEPFEFRDDQNNIAGFDIEIAKRIAAKLGKKLVIEDMAFDSLIAALSTDKIHFIIAGMTNNEDRRKNVDFSEDYYSSNQVIIVRK